MLRFSHSKKLLRATLCPEWSFVASNQAMRSWWNNWKTDVELAGPILHPWRSRQPSPKHATQRRAPAWTLYTCPKASKCCRSSTSAPPVEASSKLSWERDPFDLPVGLPDRVQQLEARGAAPHRPPLPGPGRQLPVGRRLEGAIRRMARQVGVDMLKCLARIRLSRLSRLGLRLLKLLRLLGLLPRIFSVLASAEERRLAARAL